MDVTARRDTGGMLDLVLPLECGGCGASSTRWCEACARDLWVRPDEPHLIAPRVHPGVPVFSLGRYAGARRNAIVALKEHGRTDLTRPLGAAMRAGLQRLLTWGVLDTPLAVVPAPTRRLAARRRGGDPVTRMALAATTGNQDVKVVQALRMKALVRDSVGLSSAARQRMSRAGSGCAGPQKGWQGRCWWSTTSSPPAPPPPNRCASCKLLGPRVVAVLASRNA